VSTILDALKRVEEQLRNEAGRKNRETPAHALDDSAFAGESGVQAGEDSEAMRVYHGLIDLIGGIQDRIWAEMEELRDESRARLEEARRAVDVLREECVRQEKTLYDLKLRRDVDREADCASLAESQKQAQTRLQEFMAEIDRTVVGLKREFASQREMYAMETRQRDADCEAGEVALAAVQSEMAPMKQAQSDMRQTMVRLAQDLEILQADGARMQESIQAVRAQRNDDLEMIQKAMSALEAKGVSVAQAMAADREAIAGLEIALSDIRKMLESIHQEFQSEIQKRDAESKAERAALAALQTQDEQLNLKLGKISDNLGEWERTLGAVQTGLSRQEEALRAEIQRSAPARKSTEDALAGMKSDMAAIKRDYVEMDKAMAAIAQTLSLVPNETKELREAIRNESRQRAVEREAGKSMLSEAMSRLDGLQQRLADHGDIVSETLSEAMSLLRELRKRVEVCEDALSHIHRKDMIELAPALESNTEDTGHDIAQFDAMRQARPAHAMNKREAQRLHAEAGEAYLKGDYAGALSILDAINAAFPNNRSILYNRAECLIALKRNDEARELCDYLANVLDHSPARELRETIKD